MTITLRWRTIALGCLLGLIAWTGLALLGYALYLIAARAP